LLPRTFYCLGTLCIVNFCSKEQFASNRLVTVCFLRHFTHQHTLPTGISFFLEHSTSQPPLLPRTLFSSTQFASQHPLLLITLCSSAQFTAQHTLLLSPLYSITHFATWNTLLSEVFWSLAHFHTAGLDTISVQIYIDTLPGVLGVSKNQQNV
jgi:hypothetical protein